MSGNPGGRPKGGQNKSTKEAKTFCAGLLGDRAYMRAFRKAFRERTLDSKLEALVWNYAYGKPRQALDISAEFDPLAYLAGKSPSK